MPNNFLYPHSIK